eukprot:TRINITY_DN70043_c0_g1_i1.p1 TRINITY_DN70043_c0_g1~~TRINITY_DN70043_c0_g1_i1.p1  ORF type:complete len:242 (-),score=20.00 TRINITY_DN70043_c0_g1_i1:81-779(-)
MEEKLAAALAPEDVPQYIRDYYAECLDARNPMVQQFVLNAVDEKMETIYVDVGFGVGDSFKRWAEIKLYFVKMALAMKTFADKYLKAHPEFQPQTDDKSPDANKAALLELARDPDRKRVGQSSDGLETEFNHATQTIGITEGGVPSMKHADFQEALDRMAFKYLTTVPLPPWNGSIVVRAPSIGSPYMVPLVPGVAQTWRSFEQDFMRGQKPLPPGKSAIITKVRQNLDQFP